MTSLPQQILALVRKSPGLTDRQIANQLLGTAAAQQPVNTAARGLAKKRHLFRRRREDGLIGNYVNAAPGTQVKEQPRAAPKVGDEDLSEDRLKHHLREWLGASGWESKVAWGRERGIDIRAVREDETWVIEVKGIGSRPEMRVNYFVGILGETLQRMEDPKAKYSISLPDVPQYRRLWDRLPTLAKQRTRISVLFVNAEGVVTEVAK
jgi:hypothetical protein